MEKNREDKIIEEIRILLREIFEKTKKTPKLAEHMASNYAFLTEVRNRNPDIECKLWHLVSGSSIDRQECSTFDYHLTSDSIELFVFQSHYHFTRQ